MTAKKFFKLRDELCRRMWLAQKGNLKGFGKSQKTMRGKQPDFEAIQKIEGHENIRSYSDVWNSAEFRSLRETFGM